MTVKGDRDGRRQHGKENWWADNRRGDISKNFKKIKNRLLTDVRWESCHLNARGHFALTGAGQAPGVQEAESMWPIANHCTRGRQGADSSQAEPKGFRAGNAGTEQGWAGPQEVRTPLLSPRDLGICPLLCCRLSCGHFLRGHRQVPLGRKGPRNTPQWATREKLSAPQPPSRRSPLGQRASPLRVPGTCELC